MMSFQIQSLAAEDFLHYFQMSEAKLANDNGLYVIADADFGYPCRVSLEDAKKGERMILINFEHQPGASPFRASHAIYVREHAKRASLSVDEVPDMLRTRLLSLRGFDDDHMIREAEVLDGATLEQGIREIFENECVTYAQIHFAKPGCFAANVVRA